MKLIIAILCLFAFFTTVITVSVIEVGWIAIPISVGILATATTVTWAVVTLAKQQSKK